jgi:phosphonate transport system substrate-binding protein
MLERGVLKPNDVRIIYRSKPFPSGSMVYAHDLAPTLIKKIRDCTLSYSFSPQLREAFTGADRYVEMNYKRDFEVVRDVAVRSGEALTRAGFEKKKMEAAK